MEPTLIMLLVFGGVVLLIVLWIVAMYNGLVRLRNHVDESWANIDTELKRRYDLIPNLVNTVKGYATHEKELFESVVQVPATPPWPIPARRLRKPRTKMFSSANSASFSR